MQKNIEEKYPEFFRDRNLVANNPTIFDPLYDAIEQANKKKCECTLCEPCQIKKNAHYQIRKALTKLKKELEMK